MKYFNLKTLALGATLVGSLFAGSKVQAQDYVTDPNNVTVGYYYVVSSSNPDYAWTVLPTKEMAVAKLDQNKPEFVWFVSGRNSTGALTEIGTKITDQGTAFRLRFKFGNPSWTDTDGGTYYAMGGLGANEDKQLLTIDTEWGMHNWQNVTDDGFRFSASNRGYDIAPQNGMFSNGAKLWYYGGGAKADEGRWKLLPASDVALEALDLIADPAEYVASLPAYANDGIVAECVTLAAWLQDIKANHVGTAEGQYNVSRPAFMQSGLTDWSTYWTMWGNLDNYDAADDDIYTSNINNEDALNNVKAQLQTLTDAVKGMLVERSLGLQDVEIVTLQWNGAGRYSGINGGGKWENPSDFGSPNGGNGRIALVKAEVGKYYIASQAMFMKVDAEGNRTTAASKDEATAFLTTRSSDNGLTFVTEDGWYLTGSQFTPTQTAPTQDYKINTFGNYYNISANDGARELDGMFYSSMVFPFNIGNPDKEGYNTFILKRDGTTVTAEKVDVVPAGVPFVYVAASKDDNARLPIPQENQEYVETVQNDGNLLDNAFIARVEGAELAALIPEIYSISVKDGKVGYFLGGGFVENTPANCAYITKDGAAAAEAGQFILVYDKDTETLTVETTDPTAAAIETAIAKFNELKTVVDDMNANPDRYGYELTSDDNYLVDGSYDTEDGYNGLGVSEIESLVEQFQTLIDAIKNAYIVFDTKVVVTLQTPGVGGGIGINGAIIDRWGNNFGNPNGTQGRWCIERQDDNTYTLMTRGEYITGLAAGETATHSNNADEAIRFEIKAYNNGYTIKTVDGDVYLGNNIKGYAEAQECKFNTWDNSGVKNKLIDIDQFQNGNDRYASLVVPYSVTLQEGSTGKLYTVNKSTYELEEQTIVPGGTPFIYQFTDNDEVARRIAIVQDADDITFANTPNDNTLLAGSYLQDANPGQPDGLFGFTVKNGKVGYFKGQGAKESEAAYITADVAAEMNADAESFVIIDGKLVAADADGNPLSLDVTITDAGYATFYAKTAYEVPADVTAYTGKISEDQTSLVLTAIEGGVIPAETAVVLEGAADTYTFTLSDSEATAGENDLQGTATATNTPEGALTLGVEGGKAGFYRYTGATIPAGRAYIVLSSGEARELVMVFADGETTAIAGVKTVGADGEAVYNLSGQRVAQPSKGLYIQNGKKFIVK